MNIILLVSALIHTLPPEITAATVFDALSHALETLWNKNSALGGIVHGAFASGGPFVVLYAVKKLEDKGEFRATLCLLWASLNTVLMIDFYQDGIFTTEIMTELGILMPFLVAGIISGELIHNKVDPEIFKKIVFTVLLITGIIMFFMAK